MTISILNFRQTDISSQVNSASVLKVCHSVLKGANVMKSDFLIRNKIGVKGFRLMFFFQL